MAGYKNPLKNVSCGNIQNCFWLGVVIELLSSKWKVVASCADSYITDIFFSCKRLIIHRVLTRIFEMGVKMLFSRKIEVLPYFSIGTFEKVGVRIKKLELVRTLIQDIPCNFELSHTHQYTRRQEVNKKKQCLSSFNNC